MQDRPAPTDPASHHDLASDEADAQAESRFVAAPDGLLLHVRCYGAANRQCLPVMCLPGLTRNEADFAPLARHLSRDGACPRAVFALDSRGRGRSGSDPNWRNYSPAVELDDLIAVLAALGLDRAVFVGTSRGGILTMLLAAGRPDVIAGAALNDIGPVIEIDGLMRIKGYAGRMVRPRDFAEGAGVLRELFGAQFPHLTESDWRAWAGRNWRQDPDGLVIRYDPALANTLADLSADQRLPDLWAQFEALPDVPLMVVRGALSDILSEDTVRAMHARRPDLEILEIPDQGHAPLLTDKATMARLSDFVRRCDRAS